MREGGRELKLKSDKDLMAFRAAVLKGRDPNKTCVTICGGTGCRAWGSDENMMYVVGATKAEMLTDIRKIVPDHFLLVPGVGAQGGSLADVVKYGMNRQCGLLVNSSRGIIYADSSEHFAATAGEKAREMQEEMASYLAARF